MIVEYRSDPDLWKTPVQWCGVRTINLNYVTAAAPYKSSGASLNATIISHIGASGVIIDVVYEMFCLDWRNSQETVTTR